MEEYVMETLHLVLRKFANSDFQDFSELIRDKQASKYAIYDDQFPTDEENLRNILLYFAGTDEFFAVELKSENKVIGFIGLNCTDDSTRNLGFCIHTNYQGNGYAKEAVSELLSYAKHKLNVHRLISGTAKDNIPSVELLKSVGFSITGESIGSFVNDESDNPLEFTAYSLECIL
jgi:RimJ/RimL family protein N-acetyltransferase